jgi:membrane-associated phospholipid phosphatase
MWRPTLTGPIFWHNIPEYLITMLCTLVIIDPLITKGGTPRFWLRLLITTFFPPLLAEMGKHYQVWPGHPGFPSGHTALTVALSICATKTIIPTGATYWVVLRSFKPRVSI